MKELFFSLSIILLATMAVAESWTKKEETLFASFCVLQIADVYQTSLISKNDSLSEMNSLYRNDDGNPNMAIVAGSKALITSLIWYGLNDSTDKEYMLWLLNLFQFSIVSYNVSVLLSVDF